MINHHELGLCLKLELGNNTGVYSLNCILNFSLMKLPKAYFSGKF